MRMIFALSVLAMISAVPLQAACAAPGKETYIDPKTNDAKWQCEERIRNSLDYPNRSKFEYFDNFPAEKRADGTYRVEATYQENEDGPSKKAECLLTMSESGEWQLKSITPLPPKP